MSGLNHIAAPLDRVMLGIGMRAISYHMGQARSLEHTDRFRIDGRRHVREVIGIYHSMKRNGLISDFQGGSASAGKTDLGHGSVAA